MRKTFALLPAALFALAGCSNESVQDPLPDQPNSTYDGNIAFSQFPHPDLKTMFDVLYLPGEGFQDLAGTIPITDGKSIRYFQDAIGTKDMVYNGNPTPTRIGEPPHFYGDEGGYVFLPNVNNIHWETPGQFAAIPQPFDVYYVFRDLQGLGGENYVKNGKAFNLRDKKTHMAIGLGTGSQTVGFAPGSGLLEENKISIIRIRFDGANSMMWVNNEQIPGMVDIGSGNIREMALGTANNCSHSDFFFAAAKFGTFTETEHQTVYNELARLYPPGEYPMKPFANDVTVDFDNNTWTVGYDYVNRLGYAEDSARAEVIWYEAGSGSSPDLKNQNVIDGATGRTLNRLDYPNVFPGPPSRVWLRPSIKVWDVHGNTWRHLDALWLRDNIN
ncbi:MAG: hypothetical protein AAFX87_29900 [Bacteroidota bacterium]